MGYVRDGRDRIAMDPDRRVQEAISLVFRKFAELGSLRQVHLWPRHEAMELPAQVPRTLSAPHRMEAAGLQRRVTNPDQSGLRWRLRVRTQPEPNLANRCTTGGPTAAGKSRAT